MSVIQILIKTVIISRNLTHFRHGAAMGYYIRVLGQKLDDIPLAMKMATGNWIDDWRKIPVILKPTLPLKAC